MNLEKKKKLKTYLNEMVNPRLHLSKSLKQGVDIDERLSPPWLPKIKEIFMPRFSVISEKSTLPDKANTPAVVVTCVPLSKTKFTLVSSRSSTG